ncbi:MAG: CvpA family protein [Lachnospiraceae bacterium]|nr:CvpA family protein [Lachnospiraceae bacterium]
METVMNITLIIAIIGLILLGVWGWFSGFVRMVCVLCSSIIVFVITFFVSPVTTKIMTESEDIYGFFYEKVVGNFDLPDIDVRTALENIDSIDINDNFKNNIKEGLESLAGDVNTATNGAGDYIRDRITLMIIKVAAFIITYIIVSILVGLLLRLFKFLSQLPVVNVINRVLGVVVALAVGFFAICLVLAIATLFTGGSFNTSIAEDINSSAILGWINDHNFVTPFIEKYIE